MTTIAYKNGILAGDKQTNFGSLPGRTTKVRRIGNWLVGGCGNAARIHELHQWIERGMDQDKAPGYLRDPHECPTIMMIDEGGRIFLLDGSPVLVQLEQPFWAIGSGRDFALMAMHLGKSAPEAIELASQWDTATGQGVDTVVVQRQLVQRPWGITPRDSLLQRQHLQRAGEPVEPFQRAVDSVGPYRDIGLPGSIAYQAEPGTLVPKL